MLTFAYYCSLLLHSFYSCQFTQQKKECAAVTMHLMKARKYRSGIKVYTIGKERTFAANFV